MVRFRPSTQPVTECGPARASAAVRALKSAIAQSDLEAIQEMLAAGTDLAAADLGSNALHDLVMAEVLFMPADSFESFPPAIAADNPFNVSYNTPPLLASLVCNKTFTAAAAVPDVNGQLPLHLAVAEHSPLLFVWMLMRAFPAGAATRDRCGKLLPFHYTLYPGGEEEKLKFLVSCFEGCSKEMVPDTSNGKMVTPLEFFIANGDASAGGVLALLNDGGAAMADMKSSEGGFLVGRRFLRNEKRHELLQLVALMKKRLGLGGWGCGAGDCCEDEAGGGGAYAGWEGGGTNDEEQMLKFLVAVFGEKKQCGGGGVMGRVQETIMGFVGLLDGTDGEEAREDCMWEGELEEEGVGEAEWRKRVVNLRRELSREIRRGRRYGWSAPVE
ncbi:hypothetical protein TeGR_g3127 [Tetraparma gracilis]|uniref:Ankyrin repeat-containing domain protein n=1 Tax=Tetraparma gracilis TaxID=2962635 RepID=A0ABQ6MPA7_9STRA|nr:hypothetical protein TeGR_g3127 [Tetraparma gracilis]